MLSIARSLTNVILAGKREGRYSTTSRCPSTFFNKDNSANFSGESKVQRSFLECIFFFQRSL